MGIETTRRDVVDHLDSDTAILAYLEAVFEDADPALIASALNDIARARQDAGRRAKIGHRAEFGHPDDEVARIGTDGEGRVTKICLGAT